MKNFFLCAVLIVTAVGCAHAGSRPAGKWESKLVSLGAPDSIVKQAKYCDRRDGGALAQANAQKGCFTVADWLMTKNDPDAAEAMMNACDAGFTSACSYAESLKNGKKPY